MSDKKVDSLVKDLAYSIMGTIIVAEEGWGKDLPDWIKTQITLERMANNIRRAKGEKIEEATDAEVVAYLYTLSLTAPMTREGVNVYEYLVGKYAKLPEGMEVSELDEYEQRTLTQLKRQIYRDSTKAFKSRIGRR